MENEKLSTVQAEINELVSKAQKALDEFMKLDQEKIDYIVAKCSVAGLDHHGTLAMSAIKETGRGEAEGRKEPHATAIQNCSEQHLWSHEGQAQRHV